MSDSGPVIAAASIQATTKSIQTNIKLSDPSARLFVTSF